MTYTFINCSGADAFQVHRAGCKDIPKVRKSGQWNEDADTVNAAIAQVVEGFAADDMGWSTEDFRVLPCARNQKIEGDEGCPEAHRGPGARWQG